MSENVNKKPGNPKMRKLREQNNELAASNKKLRQDLDTVLHKLNAQKKNGTEQLQEAESKVQTLSEQLSQMQATIKRKDAELAHRDNVIIMAQSESERARAEVQSYANSTSWKITAPLRAIINIFK